jgi:hypothetical protein
MIPGKYHRYPTRYHKRRWDFFFVFFFAHTLCMVMPFGVGGGGCVSQLVALGSSTCLFLEWLTLKALLPYTSCGPSLHGSPEKSIRTFPFNLLNPIV